MGSTPKTTTKKKKESKSCENIQSGLVQLFILLVPHPFLLEFLAVLGEVFPSVGDHALYQSVLWFVCVPLGMLFVDYPPAPAPLLCPLVLSLGIPALE